MLTTARKTTTMLAVVGAAALGGSAIAAAADSASPTTTATKDRPAREQLSSAVAAKVKAAALAKVPGATVLRTEAGGPYGTPYHAHVKTADGTLKVVLVDRTFTATTVQADSGRGAGKGGRGPGGPGGHGGAGETALTGDTKEQVEAAVKAKYPGATIERTETNNDSTAPYESHITTSGGEQLEVLVSKDFDVVTAR